MAVLAVAGIWLSSRAVNLAGEDSSRQAYAQYGQWAAMTAACWLAGSVAGLVLAYRQRVQAAVIVVAFASLLAGQSILAAMTCWRAPRRPTTWRSRSSPTSSRAHLSTASACTSRPCRSTSSAHVDPGRLPGRNGVRHRSRNRTNGLPTFPRSNKNGALRPMPWRSCTPTPINN